MMAMVMAVSAAFGAVYGVGDIPNVHVADSTRFVSNPDGILSQEAVDRLDGILHRVWQTTTTEPAVVVVDDIDTDDIDGFATDLFTQWGIGKDDLDNGVLLLVVKNQRAAVIRPGYGIEGVLPDGKCGRILRDDMFPKFRDGDYDGGVSAGVGRIADVLTDPDNAAELHSSQRNNALSHGEEEDLGSWLMTWVLLFLGLSLILLFITYTIYAQGKKAEILKVPTIGLSHGACPCCCCRLSASACHWQRICLYAGCSTICATPSVNAIIATIRW